jgi:serine/threonine protein kinase
MSDNQYIQAQFPREFGNYHLLAPLAQGGMGALYLAVKGDRGLERLLVIKTVLPHLADEEYLARFRDEAKVVVKLSHGTLIPVFDAGQVGVEPFLAMEFIEGRDLRAVWNRCAEEQVAFPIDVAVYIVKELCRGLAYAHSFRDLELVHRNISPPNIIVSFSGEVKLTNFGLASSTMKLEKTPPGIIYGKVAYMSPEQARGEELDGRSDLYAAAIILWEMLTGRQLFPPGKDSPQELIERAHNPRVPPPSSRAPRVPAELDEICLTALAARKEDRYANGDEFREALTAFLVSAYPQTDASRLESFFSELFTEDIERERKEREELLENIRNRVQTMPSTDELRSALDLAGDLDAGVRRASDSRQRPGGMSNNQHIQAQFPRKFGNYHLLAPLTQGSMSALYLAVTGDRGLERLLVIKTVRSHLADEEYLARFRDEAKVVVKLSHGTLIPALDAGQVGVEPFLAMEFIEGRDLRAVWNRCAKKQVAFPIDVAVYIVKELCRGLAYVHSLRDLELVHRDVSPPNIIVSFSGEVKLTDFGLASSTMKRWKSPSGIIYGKVAYMSPEQARDEELDGRSDLYAAAIMLWEMLTGRQLFPPGKDQPQDLLKRARNPRVPAPSSRAPRVPAELDEICLKALAARKEDRYASSDEFCEALTAFLASEYPQTGASRLESFLSELFGEDIERERKEREDLLEKIRDRVQTMPPTDELRRTLEQSGDLDAGVR